MLYLTGATNADNEAALVAAGVGLMIQPGNSYHKLAPRYPFHAADNGCYKDRWVEDRWLRWLDLLVPRGNCLFATAPDVYPDAAATLARSSGYFGLVRSMGYPVALVAQDGAEQLVLPWSDFDCLFIGGKKTARPRDEWKTSGAAEGLVHRARNEGKWVHMGRVNSLQRLRRARDMGCNSADGTYIKYRRRLGGDIGARELVGWCDWLEHNQSLFPFETPSLPVHRDAIS